MVLVALEISLFERKRCAAWSRRC